MSFDRGSISNTLRKQKLIRELRLHYLERKRKNEIFKEGML